MKKFKYVVSMIVMTLMSVSCSNDDFENAVPNIQQRELHTAMMLLDGSKPSFEDAGITRATTDNWANEAKIYLQFMVGSTRVDGLAIYNSTSQEWTVQYYGTIQATNDGKCEAYYFENAGEATYRAVTLTNATAIYADKSASYSFEDNTVKVTANLKPMTGRIRFKGSASQDFFLDGITSYCTYNIEENQFESASPSIFATTGKDGYSDYVYGFFADDSQKELLFNDVENNVSYARTMSANALAVAKSGYLDIPTLENRSGWSTIRFKDYSVGKADFRMIRVIGNQSRSSFYIGETEVTQGLWNAVMNTNLTGGDNLPVANVSYNDCLSFIAKLNAKTGKTFRLPTYDEWAFAYMGGNLSKGYRYSGSSSYNEVAWHSGNSDNRLHDVKTLQPNELGIYDMSGNVYEFVAWEGAGSYFRAYGGCWYQGNGYLTVSKDKSFSYATDTDSGTGLRIMTD